MKYIITSLLILGSSFSYAVDEQCAPQIANLSDLEKIECEVLKKDNMSLKKVHCKQCEISQPFLNPGYRKDIAKKQITNDLKNSVLIVVTEIFKMGQVSGYSPKSCGLQGMEAAFKNKGSCLQKNEGLIKDINNSITTGIANFTIKGNQYLNEENKTSLTSLLDQKTCPVSQAELQTAIIKNVESKFDSAKLKKIALTASSTAGNFTDLQNKLRDSGDDVDILKHPIMRELILNNPQLILNNIDKLKTPDQIKSFLYKPENIAMLSKSVNTHCSKLYENFATAICDDDVNSGNTQIGNFKDFEEVINEDFKENEKVLPYTKELFCSQFFTPKEQISSEPKSVSDLSKSIRSMNDGYDIAGNIGLEFLKSMEQQIAPYCAEYCKNNSCDSKLADQGLSKIPKETSSILKDLFDFKSPMSEEKKKIFVDSEIITKSEATAIETQVKPEKVSKSSPFIQEKEKQIFGKTMNLGQATLANNTKANSNSAYSSVTNYNDIDDQASIPEASTTKKDRILPPSTAEYLRQMSSMNRDLLDRLVKEKGAKDKYSMSDIKDQLSQMSKERPLPLPVEQQAQFFDHEWAEAAPKVMPLLPDEMKNHEKIAERQIASLGGKQTESAIKDKKYFDQRNKALEQFGTGSDKSAQITDSNVIEMTVNNDQALKKVRLDMTEDKIEKLNLSMILDQKISTDKEGKKLLGLLENKQNFLLDIEGKVAFMVEYSETKKSFELKTLKNNLPPEVFEKMKLQIAQFLSKNERKYEYQALKKELTNN